MIIKTDAAICDGFSRLADERPNSRPTQIERATARRYMKTYQAKKSEGSSFADLIRAAEERKKHGSR